MARKILFLDIETLPAEEDKHMVLKQIHERKLRKGANVTLEDFLANTSFDGAFGHILCLSYAINNEPVKCLSGNEQEILKQFWRLARSVDLFVGHNVLDFDLRFIWQRSVILGIKPSRQIPFNRYKQEPVFDIMQEWTKWDYRGRISLDELAQALRLQSPKESMDGSMVHGYYKEGRLEEIYEYCNKDVEVTREVYKKLTFKDNLP